MAKPIKTLELHYQMIQFLIIANTAFEPAPITLSPDAALILLKNVTLYQTVKKLIAFRSRKFIACHSNPSVP